MKNNAVLFSVILMYIFIGNSRVETLPVFRTENREEREFSLLVV